MNARSSPQAYVRPALVSDVDAIVELLLEGFPDKFRSIFSGDLANAAKTLKQCYTSPEGLEGIFVAEAGSKIAGVISLQTDNEVEGSNCLKYFFKNLGPIKTIKALLGLWLLSGHVDEWECYIEFITVSSSCRGTGIGSLLLKQAEGYAREKQKQYLTLYVTEDNTGARKLYRKIGFTDVRVKKSLFLKAIIGVERWVFMRKPVSGSSILEK